jgi:hypothetical protein
MPFEEKLRQLSDRVNDKHGSSLERSTKHLAGLVASVLRNGTWSELSARTEKELKDAAEETLFHSVCLDAAGYLDEKVLSSGRIVDLKLKNDLRAVQDQIQGMFDSKAAPKRGFVYVAWCQRPEEYWYVGKAGTVDRLNLSAHGKLARATADATQLSLVFPSQSKEEILSGVEASIQTMIYAITGELPKLNERRETVPVHQGGKHVDDLAKFLTKIANQVRASAD